MIAYYQQHWKVNFSQLQLRIAVAFNKNKIHEVVHHSDKKASVENNFTYVSIGGNTSSQ